MALLTEASLKSHTSFALQKSAQVLKEEAAASASKTFDIFLSHSFLDAEVILGLKSWLENEFKLSVYVDWIEDKHLSRDEVTAGTAEQLRVRMRNSRCLLFAFSTNATVSKWMPWELGFMDGNNSLVAVIPVRKEPTISDEYKGIEYLGIYPYVADGTPEGSTTKTLWVHRDSKTHVQFKAWIDGTRKLP